MTAKHELRRDLLFAFFNEIGIIEQLARNRFERALPGGMKTPHFAVLNHLVRLGDDVAPAQIARAFQVTKGTMTNTLQRLEARGLVELHPDPTDGRAKRVRLTPKGRKTREACIAAALPIFADITPVLGPENLESVLPVLRRVREYLDRSRSIRAQR